MGLLGVFSLLLLLLSSCAATTPNIPTTYHAAAKRLVEQEAHRVLSVTENAGHEEYYTFHLANFRSAKKRYQRLGGLSAGNGQIYINHQIAAGALRDQRMLWKLRMLLAHEIAHAVADHEPDQKALANTFNASNLVGYGMSHAPGFVGLAGATISWGAYLVGTASAQINGRSQELEADRLGIEYFKRLGWDCQFWVRRFQAQVDTGFKTDFRHPPEERLEQAKELCQHGYRQGVTQ